MVGAENIKQDQQHDARLGAKGDPRDAGKLPVSGAHSAVVSVCGYGGSSLAFSRGCDLTGGAAESSESVFCRAGGFFRAFCGHSLGVSSLFMGIRGCSRKLGYGLKERLRVAEQRLRDALHTSRTTCWLWMRSILPGIVLTTMLSACSGNMQGVVRGTGEPVTFAYEQELASDLLTAQVDDEAFSGKAVMRGATTTVGTGFGTAVAGPATWLGTSTIIGASYTGDFVAVLIGDRGSTLSCELQYADTSGFTTAGGVGVCRHSDGRVIDIVW